MNPTRFDAYKQFKFRVKWDGKYIPGIIKISGLKRRTEVIINREGGEPNIIRRSPGKTIYEPLILTRGRTHDTAFEEWANLVFTYGSSPEMSLKNFRKDIVIDLLNEAGQLVMSFLVYRCWPSEYNPLGELESNDTSVALESITLQYEGMARDTAVVEPKEP